MPRDQRAIPLQFTADDRRAEIGANDGVKGFVIRSAIVDPHAQRRELAANATQRRQIVSFALNRVEIGDIKYRKRIEREKAAHDVNSLACPRKHGIDRPVGRAIAHPRAHDFAIHEVNDRNCLQIPPPSGRRRKTARPYL